MVLGRRRRGQRGARARGTVVEARDEDKDSLQIEPAVGDPSGETPVVDLTEPEGAATTTTATGTSTGTTWMELPCVPRCPKKVAIRSTLQSPAAEVPIAASHSSAFAPSDSPERTATERGSAEPISSGASSLDQIARLRSRVVGYVSKLLGRRDFLESLQTILKLDPDSEKQVTMLREYVIQLIETLFRYRASCAHRDADGKDLSVEHGIKAVGKGPGRDVMKALKAHFGMPGVFAIEGWKPNSRNKALEKFGCFDVRGCLNSKHYPPLLPNEMLLEIPNFRDPPRGSLDKTGMGVKGEEQSLAPVLQDSPYKYRRRPSGFRLQTVQLMNEDAQYVETWLSFVTDQVRGEVFDALESFLPEAEERWRVQRDRLRNPSTDMKAILQAFQFGCYPDKLEEVRLRPAHVNSVYIDGGYRELRLHDVVLMRFVKTDRARNAQWWAPEEEDERRRTVLGIVKEIPKPYWEKEWTVLFYCPPFFRGSHLLPREVEIQPLTSLTPLKREIEAVKNAGFIHKSLLETILRPETTPTSLLVGGYEWVPSKVRLAMEYFSERFNEDQMLLLQQIVTHCLFQGDSMGRKSGFLCVQGPPGTGKTTAILAALSILLDEPFELKVLLCAPSNGATDLLITRIHDGLEFVDEDCRGRRVTGRGEPLLVRLSTAPGTEVVESYNLERLAEEILEKRSYAPPSDEERRRLINKVKREVLKSKDYRVLCGTLGCLGQQIIRHSELAVDVVVVDEAGQCTEPETLQAIVPLSRSRRVPRLCVLIGDPHQLPATLKSLRDDGERATFGRSLLQRLMDCRAHGARDVIRLRTQYRMHPAISRFPAAHIYRGHLEDSKKVRIESLFRKRYHYDVLRRFGPVTFIDIKKCSSAEEERHFSKFNVLEAGVVWKLLDCFALQYQKGVQERVSVAVITPYREQADELHYLLKDGDARKMMDISLNTVDSIQGREVDMVVISTVRSNKSGSIGFVSDLRRMNVALTRGRYSLVIIGDSSTLEADSDWAALIKLIKDRDGEDYHYVVPSGEPEWFDELFPELNVGSSVRWIYE